MRWLTATVSLATLAVASAVAQNIEITPISSRATIRGPAQAYTGVAIAEVLFGATDRSPLTAAQVTFEPGSRTAWHNHPAGQYLIVTSGVGWVQERGGPKREMKAGDVIWTPPGASTGMAQPQPMLSAISPFGSSSRAAVVS